MGRVIFVKNPALLGLENAAGFGYNRVERALDAFFGILKRRMFLMNWTKLGFFAGGVLFGTAGIKILSSKDAKKAYTHATAAVLRAKDCVMTTVDTVRENAGDILADAKEINETRAAAAETIEDTAEKAAE